MTIKQWIQGKRKHGRWRCFSCHYPACTECQELPTHAVPHNAMVNGKYYCDDCRYPPCQEKILDRVCGNRRQKRGGNNRFKPYTCPECSERKTANDADTKLTRKCFRCQQPLTDLGSLRNKDYGYCSDECRYPVSGRRAANGKPCRNPRARTGAYIRNPPRFDQERMWF